MDPDATLKEILSLSKELEGTGGGNCGPDEDLLDKASRLAELIEALDGWLKNKGCLPKRWQREG